MEEQERQDVVDKYIDKANELWHEAQCAYSMCMWSMTANRIYYSIVNALRALLLKEKHPVHTHSGMKTLFGQYYVLTGRFTPEEGKLFSQLETMREKADYDCFFTAKEDDVKTKFENAHIMLNHIIEEVKNQ